MNKEKLSPYYEEVENGYRQLTYEEVIDDLQKEIERLNNIINGLDNTIKNLEEVTEHKINIINKAIEYIGKWVYDEYSIAIEDEENEHFCTTEPEAINILLNILQGSDKE